MQNGEKMKKIAAMLCIISILSINVVPAYAAEPQQEVQSSEMGKNIEISQVMDSEIADLLNQVDPYLEVNSYGVVGFNILKAEEDGVSTEIIEIGNKINDFSSAMRNDSQLATRGLDVYGNWCGPGHSGGPDHDWAAIDTLDSLCRTHDFCYEDRGYFACSCDNALIKGITSNSDVMTGTEQAMAVVVAAYFLAAPCNPFA